MQPLLKGLPRLLISSRSVISSFQKSLPPSRTISRLRVPSESELSESTRQLISKHHGDNWVRAFALNEDTTRRFVTYYEDLFGARGGRLPLQERELIAVVTSAANGCGFCRANHTLGLAAAGNDKIRAKRIALDHHLVPDLSDRERALADLAEKLTLTPREVGQEDFVRLREVGFADEDILEAVETISWFNHSNRICIALGIVPDARYFE
ncbi:hypothetical protein VTN77DRAFT_6486 [Rasamsonia byssochlamydoides]|uniref:uncharacterized protein n=1 Tax=Rasamsonia byssochlamydoides TaxID=89139 RepID=UPI003743DA24